MDKNEQAVRLKELGNKAYNNKEYEKAIEYYTSAIKLNCKEHSFYSNRSLCFYNLEQYDRCIVDCDNCLQLNPGFTKAIRKRASALLNMLRFEEGIQQLKTLLIVQKTQAATNELEEAESLFTNFKKLQQYEQEQNYEEALKCLNYLGAKVISKELRYKKVECHAKVGELDEAAKHFAGLKQESSSQYFYLKGILSLYRGDSEVARRHFKEGHRLDASEQRCQTALRVSEKCEKLKEEGNTLLGGKNYEQAGEKYSQALKLDPYNKKLNSIVYSNRALVFMKKGDRNRALQDLNKSLQLNPNYVNSLVRRAEVYMQKQDYSAAIGDYGKIQEVDPTTNYTAKIEECRRKEREAKKTKDYYAILEIPKTSTDAEIKKAYKTLAMKYHPDRNRLKSEVEQEDASKKFKDIAQAHAVLSDPQKKKMYDSGGMSIDDLTGGSSPGGFTYQSGDGSNVFTFSSSGGGIDPADLMRMFGGMGGMGGGMGARMSGGMADFDFGNLFTSNSKRSGSNFANFGFGGNDSFGNFRQHKSPRK